MLVILTTVGLSSSMCQIAATYRLKDNVTLEYFQLAIQLALVTVGTIFIAKMGSDVGENSFVVEQCLPFVSVEDGEVANINKILYLYNSEPGELSFNFVISAIVVLSTIISVIMLQRTKQMGELIMMCNQMVVELLKFFATFGLYLVITLVIGIMLKGMYRTEETTEFGVLLDLFNAFNGIADFAFFSVPYG